MPKDTKCKCLDCNHTFQFNLSTINCPRCGSQWLQAIYPYHEIGPYLTKHLASRPFSLWRYLDLLPIEEYHPDLSLGDGGTPLIPATTLGVMLGCPYLYIKDERHGPTSSFKDRQAAVSVTAMKEAGITEAVLASTGNVAISYSAYAARAGIKLWAFLTSLVPSEKMREVAIYGTQVIKVTGTYDQAKELAANFANQRGYYLERGARSITSIEAMKTIAFEISEQLYGQLKWTYKQPGNHRILEKNLNTDQRWIVPDWYIQSVSGGIGPLGVLKGFQELINLGLTDHLPSLAGIQTEGCAPMVHAWVNDKEEATPIRSPRTLITTLSTGDPGRTYTLLRNILKNGPGGIFESVTDEETFHAIQLLAQMEGLSVEPAAAVAVAGLIKLVRSGVIKTDQIIVLNCTGHTMPVESHILKDGWTRNVTIPQTNSIDKPEEGLLSALGQITEDKYPTILIIDDHRDARRLISRILQAQGKFNLLEAECGKDALEIVARMKPDLLILDLMMPEMDGFSVLDTLKSNKETASIPVIVVTAKDLTPEEKGKFLGRITSLMHKGDFLSDEFLKEISSYLNN